MKYLKKFNEMSSDSELSRALLTIIDLYKSECNGDSIHPSEDFNEGDELLALANTIQDKRIKSILSSMAELCKAECDGSAEHMCDYINDDDCDYISNFLGIL